MDISAVASVASAAIALIALLVAIYATVVARRSARASEAQVSAAERTYLAQFAPKIDWQAKLVQRKNELKCSLTGTVENAPPNSWVRHQLAATSEICQGVRTDHDGEDWSPWLPASQSWFVLEGDPINPASEFVCSGAHVEVTDDLSGERVWRYDQVFLGVPRTGILFAADDLVAKGAEAERRLNAGQGHSTGSQHN